MRRQFLIAAVAAVTIVVAVVVSGTPAMAQQEAPSVGVDTEDIGNTEPGPVQSGQARTQVPGSGEQSGVQVAPTQGGFSQVESAQIEQSDAETQPATSETTQLVTSSTEVRRAVVGLIALAVITALLTALYWYKTGQQARERHQRQFGGRHRADLHGPVVPDQRGPWTNDALNVNPDPRGAGSSAYADAPAAGIALQERPAAPPTTDRPWGSGKPTWPPAPPSGSPQA